MFSKYDSNSFSITSLEFIPGDDFLFTFSTTNSLNAYLLSIAPALAGLHGTFALLLSSFSTVCLIVFCKFFIFPSEPTKSSSIAVCGYGQDLSVHFSNISW